MIPYNYLSSKEGIYVKRKTTHIKNQIDLMKIIDWLFTKRGMITELYWSPYTKIKSLNDMFFKTGKILQILGHFIPLLKNYPASDTGALQSVTFYMIVKLKVGS